MLNIKSVKLLARVLEDSPKRLLETANSASEFYQELLLVDPKAPDKVREVVCVTGRLRTYQALLHRKLLKPRHRPSCYSHGGVPGRHIKSNALAHSKSVFVFSSDVARFYPSISHQRVYRLFSTRLSCSPDVASICTKICTYNGHLALGLITSPVLADIVMFDVDHRIGIMCAKHSLVYTRYVDDISISGSYPIESGSFMELVRKILGSHGFLVNLKKHNSNIGRLSDDHCITKLVIRRGRVDVSPQYLRSVQDQLDSLNRFAQTGQLTELYYTQDQMHGKIQFISWINPRRQLALRQRFSAVDWKAVERLANSQGLVATRKRIVERTSSLDESS